MDRRNMYHQGVKPESENNSNKSGWFSASLILWVCVVVSATVATLAVASSYTRSVSSNAAFFEKLNSRTGSVHANAVSTSWEVYKVTSSISAGTYSDMQVFMNTYIASTSLTNLGCTTEKVASSLFSPFELHFVDSSIFNDLSSRSLEDWAAFGSTLSVTDSKYNAFFHNKVQLFVDNLQGHYTKFSNDGIEMMTRLSTSTQTGTDVVEGDIAHIGIWLPNAVTVSDGHCSV
jgi:hypothetical protein